MIESGSFHVMPFLEPTLVRFKVKIRSETYLSQLIHSKFNIACFSWKLKVEMIIEVMKT